MHFVSEPASGQHPEGKVGGVLEPPRAVDGPRPWTLVGARSCHQRPRDHCDGLSLGIMALDMAREGRQVLLPPRPWSWPHPMPPGEDAHAAEPRALSPGAGWAPPRGQQSAGWDLEVCVCTPQPAPAPAASRPLGLLGGRWEWVLWTRRSVT